MYQKKCEIVLTFVFPLQLFYKNKTHQLPELFCLPFEIKKKMIIFRKYLYAREAWLRFLTAE